MSEQNNQQGYPQQQYQQMNQQGYPQQNYQQMNQQGYSQQNYQQMNQQGYPQQNYQQMNQQGYPQQQYQQMNQQGYPQQQYQQMNQQGYPQQNYQQMNQQREGGIRPPQPKKSKTGLIVGIIIAVVALVAGILILIFKDKIFGSEGGYDTAEEVISNFWEGYANCDKDQIYNCFYVEIEGFATDAENMYNSAVVKQSDITIDLDGITTTYEDSGTEALSELDVKVVAAKTYHTEVPMTQVADGVTYEIIDKYDGMLFQTDDGKWYIGYQNSLGAEILTIDGEPVDNSGTTNSGNNGGSSSGNESMYLGYGDLKTMGDSTCGYVDVPSNWVIFQEIGGVDADYSYQMSSPDQGAVITMCAYDSEQTPYDAASGMYSGLAGEGTADEVVSAQVTIGGYDAYQVYAVYGNSYLITYFFTAEDGRLHYVAVDTNDELKNIVLNLEGTFRFEE